VWGPREPLFNTPNAAFKQKTTETVKKVFVDANHWLGRDQGVFPVPKQKENAIVS
jgi:hypothetical protein